MQCRHPSCACTASLVHQASVVRCFYRSAAPNEVSKPPGSQSTNSVAPSSNSTTTSRDRCRQILRMVFPLTNRVSWRASRLSSAGVLGTAGYRGFDFFDFMSSDDLCLRDLPNHSHWSHCDSMDNCAGVAASQPASGAATPCRGPT